MSSSVAAPSVRREIALLTLQTKVQKHISILLGQLLTIVDATLPESQAKSTKDLVKQQVWHTQGLIDTEIDRYQNSQHSQSSQPT